MNQAADRLYHGQFVQAGECLGAAFFIAALHACSDRLSDEEQQQWRLRQSWADACSEVAAEMQASVDDCGTMRMTVDRPFSDAVLHLSARMGVIPQRALGMGLDIISVALGAIEEGREVRLFGPGIQMAVTGDDGQMILIGGE